MNIVEIKFNSPGFAEVLSSPGAHSLVSSATNMIAERANGNNYRGGEGFKSSVFLGGSAGRWIGVVSTTDRESRIAEAEDKALSRSL